MSKVPQVAKQPDALELGTGSFFVEVFLLGSHESILRPEFFFQQKDQSYRYSLKIKNALISRKRKKNVEQNG